MKELSYDPLNIVICGIGGQGNVLASEVLGSTMNDLGFRVSVGETYGASQRGVPVRARCIRPWTKKRPPVHCAASGSYSCISPDDR